MKKTIFGILLFSLSTLNVSADGQTTAGVGAKSCATWINLRAKTEPSYLDTTLEAMMLSWVQGYLSGASFQRTGALDGEVKHELLTLPNVDTINNYLDNYCRDNQLAKFKYAAIKLFVDVRSQN
ncbi:hypothetical protein [Methylophaga nitratireducenticrescens]|uniref:hypothetical protein n=1 Tax=Methylophaga nitratireducenticrescens TaxID=754476 RepID=UPI000CDBFC1D|nr:hypothetical protein [Methylophaga nitratireducenticrescens]AUZ83800.1 hypothetical protein CDW43_04085 [Methylophaga nitratireducenticrescens]